MRHATYFQNSQILNVKYVHLKCMFPSYCGMEYSFSEQKHEIYDNIFFMYFKHITFTINYIIILRH